MNFVKLKMPVEFEDSHTLPSITMVERETVVSCGSRNPRLVLSHALWLHSKNFELGKKMFKKNITGERNG